MHKTSVNRQKDDILLILLIEFNKILLKELIFFFRRAIAFTRQSLYYLFIKAKVFALNYLQTCSAQGLHEFHFVLNLSFVSDLSHLFMQCILCALYAFFIWLIKVAAAWNNLIFKCRLTASKGKNANPRHDNRKV